MHNSPHVDPAGRVVVGRLRSSQQLNADIAHHLLSSLRTAVKLVPSTRNSKHGWMSTLESPDGTTMLYSSDFRTQAEALEAAKEASELLTR